VFLNRAHNDLQGHSRSLILAPSKIYSTKETCYLVAFQRY